MNLFRVFAAGAGVLLLTVCTGLAGYRIRTVQINRTSYLLGTDVAGYYGLRYSLSGEGCVLRSKEHLLRFTVDRREATLDGMIVNLSVAPVLWRGKLIFAETDFRLLLDPILRPASVPRQVVGTIIVDPGHGGRDQGTAGAGYLEKSINLEVARKLVSALRRDGYHVYLTRPGDDTLTLEQRPAIARRLGGNLFLSLHSNAVADRAVNGIETYFLPPGGTASTYSQKAGKSSSSGNRFDKANARLAYDIQRGLLASTRATDRGIKHANFAVLREGPCPAVLIEIGFMSNAAEGKNLGRTPYQDRLVNGIVAGVRAYHRNVRGKR